ncbi:MAG: transposase [Moraxellaceae bacterium]|nr:transposase [Moraxellaceae bacterium]
MIKGGLASARLLAWIIVSKFADHLPLYRLGQIAARQQVPLPRSTLSSWVGLVGYALGELVGAVS